MLPWEYECRVKNIDELKYYYYYYYCCLMGFWDGSAISRTIRKHTAPRSRQKTTPTPHHSIFTGWMLFLVPNQQWQSTEGTDELKQRLVNWYPASLQQNVINTAINEQRKQLRAACMQMDIT